jgi:hypothetical protein
MSSTDSDPGGKVDGRLWIRWTACAERVDGIHRIQWTVCAGFGGRHGPDYAEWNPDDRST